MKKQLEAGQGFGASSCSPFFEAAEELEKLAPCTSEQLMVLASYLPPLAGDDAKVALAMVAALVTITGQTLDTYAKAVKAGVHRAGSVAELRKEIAGIAADWDQATKRGVVERLFGSRFAWSGQLLVTEDCRVVLERLLANVETEATPATTPGTLRTVNHRQKLAARTQQGRCQGSPPVPCSAC